MSEVDVTGHLLRSFTDVDKPEHLSVDSEGHVLVADYGNDRILLLNSQLQLQRVLIDNSQLKLREPERLCYDELTCVVHCSSPGFWWHPDVVSLFTLR